MEKDILRKRAVELLKSACIVITDEEFKNMEIADFGLKMPEIFGLQLIIYINTERVCAKELILLPNQICPEHRHPPIHTLSYPGKEETFRCRWGEVYLYVPYGSTDIPYALDKIPVEKREFFTVWKEIKLTPGQQYTIPPNTLHWFIAGKEGAIVSEFSTTSYDEYDIFTDPQIVRVQ